MEIERRLQRAVARTAQASDVAGVVVRVERPGDGWAWTGAHGELGVQSPFFIASTTKLYTAAIIRRLVARGLLAFDDRLVDRADPALVAGLHVLEGVDHTPTITVRQLLSHSSGLPDYFQGRPSDGGPSLEERLRSGHDDAWDVGEAVAIARSMGPVFPPGARGWRGSRASYSDTNFQLLGHLIERVTGGTYEQALQAEVLAPLALTETWLYTDPNDQRPMPLRDGPERLDIPNAMTSFGPDGGIVATVEDLMTFLRALDGQALVENDSLDPQQPFHAIFFPLRAGSGVTMFRLPRILSPFAAPPVLVGHSGLSGAFAFADRDRGLYLAGTVNNLTKPSRSFQLMGQLVQAVDRAA